MYLAFPRPQLNSHSRNLTRVPTIGAQNAMSPLSSTPSLTPRRWFCGFEIELAFKIVATGQFGLVGVKGQAQGWQQLQ